MKIKLLLSSCLFLFLTTACGLSDEDKKKERDKKGSDLDKKEVIELEKIGNMPIKDIGDAGNKAKVEKFFIKLLAGANREGLSIAKWNADQTRNQPSAEKCEAQKKISNAYTGVNEIHSKEVAEKESEIIALTETQALNTWRVHLCLEKSPKIIEMYETFKCENIKSGDKKEGVAVGGAAATPVNAAGAGAEKDKKGAAVSQKSPYNDKLLLIFSNDQSLVDDCLSFSNYVDSLLPLTKTKTYLRSKLKEGGVEAVATPVGDKEGAAAAPAAK